MILEKMRSRIGFKRQKEIDESEEIKRREKIRNQKETKKKKKVNTEAKDLRENNNYKMYAYKYIILLI